VTTPVSAYIVVGLLVIELGNDWEIIPNPHDNDNYQAFTNKKTGAQFYGSTQKCDGKLRIGVHIPNNWPKARDEKGNEVSRPSIKMNQDKATDKMAKDFLGRFVEEGTDFFRKSLAALNATECATQKRLNNRKNLAESLGAEWTHYFAEHNITTTVKKVHVSANVTTADNVELTLSYLTVEQAQQVIALLKG
jgi:hypothetical protein